MANVLSLVSYKIFPAKLGGQKGIALFNKYLNAFHKLICVTVRDNDPSFAEYKVLNILSNHRSRYWNVFYFFKLARVIKKYDITCMIIEHPYYGWLGLLLKKFCNIKLVVHSHNIESYRFKTVNKWWWRLLHVYEKYVYKHADKTFCISAEDKNYMVQQFKLQEKNCIVITYGIEWNCPPSEAEKLAAREILESRYAVNSNCSIYFFNGTLDYLPNLNAVKTIVRTINPILQSFNLNYKIIICGKNLPAEMNELKEYRDENIIYAGFVDDVSVYFKGANGFINPVIGGGGIKTKLVEALGYDLVAVSSESGAIGVDEKLCNGKLLVTADLDWNLFAVKMQQAANFSSSIGKDYFEHFYWGNIAKKAADAIENLNYNRE